MSESGVETCRYCPAEVVVRQLVVGQYRPFNRAMVPADEVGEPARYVPVSRAGTIVMVLASDVADDRLAGVRWFATRHTCAEGLRAWHDAKEDRRLTAELASMWGMPESEVAARNAQAAKVEALDREDPDRYADLHRDLVKAHQAITRRS